MPLLGAFIVPHPPLAVAEVGHGEEQRITQTLAAYEEVAKRIDELKPETLIISSPHAVMYADYFHVSGVKEAHGSLADFRAPNVRFDVPIDTELAHAITRIAQKESFPAGVLGERQGPLDHGLMVPLYFIRKRVPTCPIVEVSLSGLSPRHHYRMGQIIAQAIAETGRRVVYIASGDLSHKLTEEGPYGYAAEGPAFDQKVTTAIAHGDWMTFLTLDENFCEAAAECGLRSFQIMAGLFDGLSVTSELLSYEGPFGVGYAVAAILPGQMKENRQLLKALDEHEAAHLSSIRAAEDPYVKLARMSLETFVKTHRPAERPNTGEDALMKGRAGVFVSIHENGRLRGCIGTIRPVTACVADEIIRNAVSAGSEDPRFDPIEAEELPFLEYHVDVLEAPEAIASSKDLNPKLYGVIVSCGARRGLLLPDLPGVDTVEKQIDIARQKGNIGPHEAYTLSRFKVTRHH